MAGAGVYITATTPAYKTNYQMFDYVTSELPAFVEANLPSDGARKSVFGHSMGTWKRQILLVASKVGAEHGSMAGQPHNSCGLLGSDF